MDEILDSHRVNYRGASVDSRGLAQKGGLFAVAFDQMNPARRIVSERAGNHQSGKSAARAEVDPASRLWRQRQELQRVGDMPGPYRFAGSTAR